MSVENLKNSGFPSTRRTSSSTSSLSRARRSSPSNSSGAPCSPAAAASKSATILREIAEEAADNLSAEAYNAALGAASIMGMNNVFYRGKAFLGGRYDDLRAGLRMQIIGTPGVDKVDFELWSFAVSRSTAASDCTASTTRCSRRSR